jgi:hypothetical protein
VVGLFLQLDPVTHAEAPGHLARELNPARPVQRRVLTRVQRGLAVLVGGRVPDGLAAGPAVADGDRRPLCLLLAQRRVQAGAVPGGSAQL